MAILNISNSTAWNSTWIKAMHASMITSISTSTSTSFSTSLSTSTSFSTSSTPYHMAMDDTLDIYSTTSDKSDKSMTRYWILAAVLAAVASGLGTLYACACYDLSLTRCLKCDAWGRWCRGRWVLLRISERAYKPTEGDGPDHLELCGYSCADTKFSRLPALSVRVDDAGARGGNAGGGHAGGGEAGPKQAGTELRPINTGATSSTARTQQETEQQQQQQQQAEARWGVSGKKVVRLPCDHTFHKRCIQQAFTNKDEGPRCPRCRRVYSFADTIRCKFLCAGS